MATISQLWDGHDQPADRGASQADEKEDLDVVSHGQPRAPAGGPDRWLAAAACPESSTGHERGRPPPNANRRTTARSCKTPEAAARRMGPLVSRRRRLACRAGGMLGAPADRCRGR